MVVECGAGSDSHILRILCLVSMCIVPEVQLAPAGCTDEGALCFLSLGHSRGLDSPLFSYPFPFWSQALPRLAAHCDWVYIRCAGQGPSEGGRVLGARYLPGAWTGRG
jgi:hypothetical protein